MKNIEIPKKGLDGLKAYFKTDAVSGFLVFLLALPLSLGIAKASGFPPAMGVLTAIVGGLVTSLFNNVGELTIKGPAAGLITVCSGAITELGDWHYAAAIVVIVGALQVILSYLKVASLSDMFPISVVHGMLAAIGIIIIAKQIPVILGDDPLLYKGETPLELLSDIPRFIMNEHLHIALVGLLGLVLMFVLPAIKLKWLQKIPAPMIVLTLTIPLAISWNFKQDEGIYSLVQIGDFWGDFGINADFSKILSLPFWKYVVMFLFVNSLESLLTVKAIDHLDPYKRESNYNGDLKAVGIGNSLTGLLGGLPMISEVVRSSANVGFGAKTKWSNLMQGVFLLISMILIIPFIEMIPNAALAAMLMYAGFRLAAPKEFIHTYHIGAEQLAIFLITIVITLAEDLLLGVAAGILLKMIFHMVRGVSFKMLFSKKYELNETNQEIIVKIQNAAIFTNLVAYKKLFENFNKEKKITIDFSETILIDHSFMSFVHHVENRVNQMGGHFKTIGMDNHKPLSNHKLAARKLAA